MAARRTLPFLVALTLLGASCRDPKVSSYRVPKEKDPESPAAPAPATANPAANAPVMPGASGGTNPNMAATPVATATGADLVWDAPPSWKPKAASAMRKATYLIGEPGAEAELSITAFPNDVGGEAANINRWRGQVSLAPMAETDLAAAVLRVTSNDLAIAVVDFVGPTPAPPKPLTSDEQRKLESLVGPAALPLALTQNSAQPAQHLLGAIVPFKGATWFFKLLGPDAVVAKAKPDFVAFLKTLKAAP